MKILALSLMIFISVTAQASVQGNSVSVSGIVGEVNSRTVELKAYNGTSVQIPRAKFGKKQLKRGQYKSVKVEVKELRNILATAKKVAVSTKK
jgi:hypothetical protein